MAYLMFYIPCPDETVAKNLGEGALREKLAACANWIPATSAFWWNGNLNMEKEWLLVLKTALHCENQLEAFLNSAHPYEIPCLARFEVRANQEYETWVNESVI